MKNFKSLFFSIFLLTVILIVSISANIQVKGNTYTTHINIVCPETNPTDTTGSYGTYQPNNITGIGYTLPVDTNGSGIWYINQVRASLQGSDMNTAFKAVIIDENKTIIQTSYVLYGNMTRDWLKFEFNTQVGLIPQKVYYFGIIADHVFALYLKNNAYGGMFDFFDMTNDFINPTNPTDGTYYSTGANSIYITLSDVPAKAYNYIYEPNSINSGTNALWAYDYVSETYGVNAYCPIGTTITYIGQTFIGGLKTGNGTFTIYKTGISSSANQWQTGSYTYVATGNLTNGILTFQLAPRTNIGYEGIQIIINITTPSLIYPTFTINHSFRWGADSNGNIPTTNPTGTGNTNNSGNVIISIISDWRNDAIIIIYAVACGLCTYLFAFTGLIAGFDIATVVCFVTGLLGDLMYPVLGLAIIANIALIITGSGLLSRAKADGKN